MTSSSELLFGVYAASQVSAIAGPPDNRAAIGDLVRRLQGDAPFVVREYLHYLGTPPDPERAAVLHPDRVYGELTMPDQWYLDGHRQLDLVLCYLPVAEDVEGWLRFIDRAIDRYGEIARYLQITLEPNFNIPWIDGSSPGVMNALVQGIAHARKTLDTIGLERVRVGFSVAEPPEWMGGDGAFWDGLAVVPPAEFAEQVDYVGLALYPDAFSPVAPHGTPGDIASLVEHGIAQLREVNLPKVGIGSHVPIHIAECGSVTGTERSPEHQADSIDHMVRAVVAVRERFHVRHLELFSLRDADSERSEPHAQLGITTSDYTPKVAFETYRKLVAEFSA
ncbi:hypothetical protein HLB23_06685 [Nocardia uniformis]|uniref:Arabinogalactan endo-beta-1,4-galactanase n=1 Tax=Nocardia uniformis TaxID=53432 RepID=A0A849BX19_9NOCA|nr:hypothetical protein [Nocardia uniformis]NNH69556.1 hypothetical protein [Nocardia uniformis]